jgi:hypothetical protein
MRLPVATCAICDEPIWMDLSNSVDRLDVLGVQQGLGAVMAEHLRSHPEPVQARFWLRRFLDDVRPTDRAVVVKRIYTELRSLWGDQDSRGLYTIDEVLGSACLYRLWLSAQGCSYAKCRHTEAVSHPENQEAAAGPVAWHRQLLGSILPPPYWSGSAREWRQLAAAITRNCTCPSTAAQSVSCPAHRLLADPRCFNRLLFGRRMARRLELEEFADHRRIVAGASPPAPTT